ncbi:MAG: transglycosylase domain-containing protein, partial [Bifidobacteriaceae bacterium]|nr:transglycosylase domain-containing protein [Bifidobacteriaceae bacterium]
MPSKTRKTSSAKPKTWGNKKLGTTTKKNSTASAKSSAAKKSTSHKNTSPRPSNNNNHKKRKTQSKHRVLKFFLIFFGSLFALGVAAFIYLYATTSVPKAEDMALAQKTTVYYSDGKTQIGSFAQQNREIIECGTLPDYVGNAVVSSENRTFWTDSGIDLRGIGRALINNVTKGTRQGGSTITQQYAERYYLGQTESYLGKLREAFLALKITQSQDKSTVLCNYMNTIYFGRDAYGIEAAAKNYFGKSAKDLTLSESVLLAGIIPAPNTWDPANNKAQAESRFERTLNIMVEDGYVTEAQAKKATFPD